MRIVILIIVLLVIKPIYAGSLLNKENCTFKGISLKGNVKVVDVFADINVKKVTVFPDLNVRFSDFPSKCGEWKIVDAFPDFTIRYVDAFEDITIREVDAFPGID